MPTKYKYLAQTEHVEFCCGVRQVGGFEESEVTEFSQKRYDPEGKRYSEATGWFEDKKAALDYSFQEIFKNGQGCPLQFWFKKSAIDTDEYYDEKLEEWRYSNDGEWAANFDAAEMRNYLRALPSKNLVTLGCYVNPNTGNLVDGYMYISDAVQINKENSQQ